MCAQFSIPWHLAYQRLQVIIILCISYFSKYLTEAAYARKHLLWLMLQGIRPILAERVWCWVAECVCVVTGACCVANQEMVNWDQKWVRLSPCQAAMPLIPKVPSSTSQITTSWGANVQTHKPFSHPIYNFVQLTFSASPAIVLQSPEPLLGQSMGPEKKQRACLWSSMRSHLSEKLPNENQHLYLLHFTSKFDYISPLL